MMELYKLAVDGYAFYFSGDLSNDDIVRIEGAIHTMKSKTAKAGHEVKQKEFFNTVMSELQLRITPIAIKYVFRI